MNRCGMTGCHDMAEFVITGQWQLNGKVESFEICESCGNYWKRAKNNPWQVTLTKLNEQRKENAK